MGTGTERMDHQLKRMTATVQTRRGVDTEKLLASFISRRFSVTADIISRSELTASLADDTPPIERPDDWARWNAAGGGGGGGGGEEAAAGAADGGNATSAAAGAAAPPCGGYPSDESSATSAHGGVSGSARCSGASIIQRTDGGARGRDSSSLELR